MHHSNVNVSLIEEDVIQVDVGITINVDMSIKNVIYVNNPATCSLKMNKNWQVLLTIQ